MERPQPQDTRRLRGHRRRTEGFGDGLARGATHRGVRAEVQLLHPESRSEPSNHAQEPRISLRTLKTLISSEKHANILQ